MPEQDINVGSLKRLDPADLLSRLSSLWDREDRKLAAYVFTCSLLEEGELISADFFKREILDQFMRGKQQDDIVEDRDFREDFPDTYSWEEVSHQLDLPDVD